MIRDSSRGLGKMACLCRNTSQLTPQFPGVLENRGARLKVKGQTQARTVGIRQAAGSVGARLSSVGKWCPIGAMKRGP